MSISIEKAIKELVAIEVAAAEQRIIESLKVHPETSLSFNEACEYLNMSDYTLRNLCRTKKIPFRTVGAEGSRSPRYIFNSGSLNKWMKAQEAANYIVD